MVRHSWQACKPTAVLQQPSNVDALRFDGATPKLGGKELKILLTAWRPC